MNQSGLLVLIPARGGSKGIPNKNSRKLGGMPLLAWTAAAVHRAELEAAAVILSTDDPEIAEIGQSIGLDVPFLRPPELATDEATVESVAIHAMDWLVAERGMEPDTVMLLQPTSPFRPPWIIPEALRKLEDPQLEGVISVKALYRTPATLFHAREGLRLDPLGSHKEHRSRRQETKALYTPNGALYLVRGAVLRDVETFYPARLGGVLMDSIASLDIDEAPDWDIAEAVAASGATWRGSLSSSNDCK